MIEINVRHIGQFFCILLIFFLGILLIFKPEDTYFFSGWFAVVFLSILLIYTHSDFKISGLDICIFLFGLYEVFSLLLSPNPIAGYPYLASSFIGVCYYFVLRFYLNTEDRIKSLIKWYSVFICLVSIIALYSFSLFVENLSNVGWDNNVSGFKFLYRPLGYLNNVWNTFSIVYLGILGLCGWYCRDSRAWLIFLYVALILVIINILFSFSRGANLALSVFLLGSTILFFCCKMSLRKKIGLFILTLSIIAFALIPYYEDVLKSMHWGETVSQQRSVSGRIASLYAAWTVFKEKPVIGFGSGNYSLAVDSLLFEKENVAFTNFAPNILVQLGVEKGITGFLIFGLFMGYFFWYFIKEKKNGGSYFIALTILAVGIKEMTFSSLLECEGIRVLLITLLAIWQNRYISCRYMVISAGPKLRSIAVLSLVILCSFVTVFIVRHNRNEYFNYKCLENINLSRLDSASFYISKTHENLPYLINRSTVNWLQYNDSKDKKYLESSIQYLREAISINPKDVMLHYNMSVLLECIGRRDSAQNISRRLLEKCPDNALFCIGAFNLEYKSGEMERAVSHLTHAIKLSPKILETDLWKQCALDNSYVKKNVIDFLIKGADRDSEDPIYLAKYGKIFLCIGDTVSAKEYLDKSIKILPNLVYPWYYLAEIEYCRGHEHQGDFYMRRFSLLGGRSTEIERIYQKNEYEYKFLSDRYEVKFRKWYDSRSCPFSVFLPVDGNIF